MFKCIPTTAKGTCAGVSMSRINVDNICVLPPSWFNDENLWLQAPFGLYISPYKKPWWNKAEYDKFDKHGFSGPKSGTYHYGDAQSSIFFYMVNSQLTSTFNERWVIVFADKYDREGWTVQDWVEDIQQKYEKQQQLEAEGDDTYKPFPPEWDPDRDTLHLARYFYAFWGAARASAKALNPQFFSNPPERPYTAENLPSQPFRLNPGLDLEKVDPITYEQADGLDFYRSYVACPVRRLALGGKAYVYFVCQHTLHT